MAVENAAQLVQRQRNHTIKTLRLNLGRIVDTRKKRAVQLAPRDIGRCKALLAHLVAHAGQVEDAHCRRGVVRGTRVLVELVGLVQDGDGDVRFGKEKPENLAGGACSHDRDLFWGEIELLVSSSN